SARQKFGKRPAGAGLSIVLFEAALLIGSRRVEVLVDGLRNFRAQEVAGVVIGPAGVLVFSGENTERYCAAGGIDDPRVGADVIDRAGLVRDLRAVGQKPWKLLAVVAFQQMLAHAVAGLGADALPLVQEPQQPQPLGG